MDNHAFIPPVFSLKVMISLLLLGFSSCVSLPRGYYIADIPLEIDDASYFRNGLLTIESEGQLSVIDTSGRYVFDFILDADNRVGYINDKSRHSLSLVDDSGKPISNVQYDWISEFNRGYAIVGADGKEGLIDIYGNSVIDPRYEALSFFSSWPIPAKQNGKWGFLDSVGNIIIPFVYDDVRPFSEGIAAVRYSDNWGFIDSTGNLVIEYQYNTDNRFEPIGYPYLANDGRIIAIKGNKCGLIDTAGNIILPFTADDMLVDKDAVILLFKKSDYSTNYYLSDRDGVWKSGPYTSISKLSDSLYSFELDGHCGLLKLNVGIVLPATFDYIGDSHHPELILVKKDGKYGFADNQGRIVIPADFDWLGCFSEGLCAFKKRNHCGYIDIRGNQIIRMKGYYDYLQEFHEGYAKVRKDINQPCYFIRRKQ